MGKTINKNVMYDIMPASVTEEGIDLSRNNAAIVSGSEIQQSEVAFDEDIEAKSSKPEMIKNGVGLDDLVLEIADVDPKEIVGGQLEAMLNEVEEPLVELASIGAQVPGKKEPQISVLEFGLSKKAVSEETGYTKEELFSRALANIKQPLISRVATLASSYVSTPNNFSLARSDLASEVGPQAIRAKIIEEEVISFYKKEPEIPEVKSRDEFTKAAFVVKTVSSSKLLNFAGQTKKKKFSLWLVCLVSIGILAYGLTVKNEIIKGGSSAISNLEKAGENLKSFNFSMAADDFGKSYKDFNQTSQTMNFMGAGLAGLFSEVPGLDKITAGGINKISSAKNLAEAGKLIAQSGESMSQALSHLSQTGLILNPFDKNSAKPVRIIHQIRNALVLSSQNFQKAKALIADVDESAVPEEKRERFGDFKEKIPLLEGYLNHAIEYTEFLEGIVGIDNPRKYLLLFNNNSELRPTGGFPGTYGVVTFAGGGLQDFFVDDVYNLDGQIKRNIIPPKQLQHITPTLGMRDASWFIDFPYSAKKAMAFFAEEAGYGVDGVIAMNPDIVSGILGVIGPIEMPEYGMMLTADNFVESIQEEVEYGDNRTQPKKVVVDFAPRFLAKLYSADSEKWMKIFDILMTGLDEKDILFYFKDVELEKFSTKEGFGGEIRHPSTSSTGSLQASSGQAGDYMTVNFSNIKGSKTDAVTDSSISIDTRFGDGQVVHHVAITRNHKGGDHEHGFYNRQNPAYVRILLPPEALLLEISGNDLPAYRSLVNYNFDGSFEKDRDLALFESSFQSTAFPGVEIFEEVGKKGIGFWMITDPKTTKKIEFEYMVPMSDMGTMSDYNFYFQKQPGLDWKNLRFTINESDKYSIINTAPSLNRVGSKYVFDELLKLDFEVRVKLQNK